MIHVLRQHYSVLTINTIEWSKYREQVIAIQRLDDNNEQVPLSTSIHLVSTQLASAIPGKH